MRIGGILTAMVTPFDAQGRVNEDAAVRLMHHLLENGSDGIVVAATTGEGTTLTDEEKLRLFDLAVTECGGDAMVIAGTGSNDTAHSVHLTAKATEVGVDAVLAVTPYYNKPNRRGLFAHFEEIAAATDKPVILYNIPSRVVIDMPNDFMAELADRIPNVAAVKQARTEDIEPIPGLELLAGNDDKLAEVLDKGGSGGICVCSAIVGNEMRRMIDEPEARWEINAEIADVIETLMGLSSNPIPLKAALNMLGHDVGGLRLPMVEADEDEQRQIRAMLEHHGLLSAV
ncbi:MAG: 4-hydroxy-tetrahydrodipicolinate synthase [Thermoleophilaceae bacterium]